MICQLLYAGEPTDQLGAVAEAFGILACDLPGIPLAQRTRSTAATYAQLARRIQVLAQQEVAV